MLVACDVCHHSAILTSGNGVGGRQVVVSEEKSKYSSILRKTLIPKNRFDQASRCA